MTKRPTIQELHNQALFTLVQSFHIDDTMKFLMGQLNKQPKIEKPVSKVMKYLIWGVAFFGFMSFAIDFGYSLGKAVANEDPSAQSKIDSGLQIGVGLLLFYIILLPIHELIHGAVFKYFKAPKVGYGFSLKAGMVYAYAQKFPISMPELRLLAMMPFYVLTTLMVVAFIVFPQFSVGIGMMLLIHTIGCIGDFALTKYSLKKEHQNIYTYDDLEEEKKTYFFEKV